MSEVDSRWQHLLWRGFNQVLAFPWEGFFMQRKRSVKINQINFSYIPLEDRLLFRLNTLDKTEFRMWLTRAMSLKLLGLLKQAVKINLDHEQRDLGQPAIQAVADFRREAVLAEADYKTAFSSGEASFPLGTQPILVSDAVLDSPGAVPVLVFQLAVGRGVSVSIDHDLGLAISKLLSDVLGGLDWGVEVVQGSTIGGAGGSSEMMVH